MVMPTSFVSAGRAAYGSLIGILGLLMLIKGKKWRRIDLLLLLFPAIIALSFFNAYLGYQRLTPEIFRWLVPLICLAATMYGVERPKLALESAKRWILFLAPISLVIFYFGVATGRFHGIERGGDLRYAFGFSGTHSAGYFFGFVACLLWSELRRSFTRLSRAHVSAGLAGLLCLLLAIYYTGTRTVMVFVTAFIFFNEARVVPFRRALRRLFLPTIVVILYILNSLSQRVSLFEFFRNLSHGKFIDVGKDMIDVGGGRVLIWVTSLFEYTQYSSWEKLIGSGLGADYLLTWYRWGRPLGSHNDYLTVLLDTGAVGLLALALWYLWVWRALRSEKADRSILAFGQALVFAAIVSNFISNAFVARPLAATYLWVLAGLALGHARTTREADAVEEL